MSLALSAVIPAAGISGRMGSDKGLLLTRGGLTFASHLVNCFRLYGCKPVVLVVNDKAETDHSVQGNHITVVNHHVEFGRSYSIRLGLAKVPMGSGCFIHNIDNPCLEPVLLDRLLDLVRPGSYVVPMCAGKGGHPILLGNQMVDDIRGQDRSADFREALSRFKRVELPWHDEGILWNINTPEDFNRYIRGNG